MLNSDSYYLLVRDIGKLFNFHEIQIHVVQYKNNNIRF